MEHAQTGTFVAWELLHRVVIVHLGPGLLVRRKRNVIVEVEVAAERRNPLEVPPHAFLERFDLRQRCPRDHCQRHVACREVRQRAVKMVGHKRAARASLFPVGMEHEVVDDQLAAPGEEIGQGFPAIWAVEGISLSIFTHGSSRRWRLTSSRNFVNSFSRVSKSLRATTHCSLDTILEGFASVMRVLGSIFSNFILSFSSFMTSIAFFGNMTNEEGDSGHQT